MNPPPQGISKPASLLKQVTNPSLGSKPKSPSFLKGSSGSNLVDIDTQVGSYFGYTCIGNFISNLVSMGIIIAGIAVFIYLVWGGIEWITSAGDKTKTETAQKRISNAIIGLTIVAVSWAVWNIILYFFGINIDTLCTQNPLGN